MGSEMCIRDRSSEDMGKVLSELIKGYSGQGILLTTENYQEFFRTQLSEEHFSEGERDSYRQNPYKEDYDPAIFIGHSAHGYAGHSGGDAGVATWLFFNKEKKTGRYIVVNVDFGNDERARELQYYAIWDEMDKYLARLSASEL